MLFLGMRKLSITLVLLSLSCFSYSQVTITPKVNKYEKPILRTDSIVLETNTSTLIKRNLTFSNFRICLLPRDSFLRKPYLHIIKYGKWEERSKDSLFLTLIFPNDIEAIHVPKTSALVEEYGEDAKNGVILVTLKRRKALEYKKKFEEFKAENK